jgi:ABC-2 type transport system permease protein
MRRLITAELLKLTTTRLAYLFLVTVAGLTAAVTLVTGSRAGGAGHMAPPPLDTAAGLTRLTTLTNFGLILAMVLGAIVSSGEYRSTATATYLAAPHRGRELVAKLVAAGFAGLLYGLAAAGVATGVGLAWVSAKGYPVTLSSGTLIGHVAGAALAGALLAMLGVGIGTLVRRQAIAVVSVFVWALALEPILGALYTSAARFLPFNAAAALSGQPVGKDVASLPFVAGVAVVAGIAGVTAIVAASTTLRADVV